MSAKKTSVRNLREVLRLSYSAGLSIRKISVGSIQNILKNGRAIAVLLAGKFRMFATATVTIMHLILEIAYETT
ncbi:MAG: hypothetical protein PHH11_11250 [Methylomonas sp.]|nr:hypothetical protein [Methylomonas sp.]